MRPYKSKAFVYYKPEDVRLEDIEITPSDTDLVVKVLACGRCGTDRTIYYKGHYKVDRNAPIVLGHELAGEIVYVGKNVVKLKKGIGYKEGKVLSSKYLDFRIGERVTVQSRIAKYENGLLILSDPINILSFYINGGYSQYMKIPSDLIQSGSVLRIPEGVSAEEALLVEPAACALESIFATPHAMGVDREGRHIFSSGIKRGGRSCVIGSGTVSMIYAMLCKVEGARQVYVIVRSQEKAELVKKILGESVITVILSPYRDKPIDVKEKIENSLVERLSKETNGELFDDVVSACPDSDSQRLMLKLYNIYGYAVGACFGGTHEKVDRADLDINHYRTAKTIGTSGCSNKTMETVISWLEKKRISLKGFTSANRYTLKTTPREFFTTDAGGLKPVLYPWET